MWCGREMQVCSHHRLRGAVVRDPQVPGRTAHAAAGGVPGGAARAGAGEQRAHDAADQLLHEAEGEGEAARLHLLRPSRWAPLFSFTAGIHFDIEMAVEVLRRAQCFEEALHLSKKHNLFTTFLRIQIEDKQDFRAAIDYIRYAPHQSSSVGRCPPNSPLRRCNSTAASSSPTTASKPPTC